MSHQNRSRVPDRMRVAASSTLVLLYGLGSLAGPLVSSALMKLIGDEGFFLSLAGICGALAGWALIRSVAAARASRQPTELPRG